MRRLVVLLGLQLSADAAEIKTSTTSSLYSFQSDWPDGESETLVVPVVYAYMDSLAETFCFCDDRPLARHGTEPQCDHSEGLVDMEMEKNNLLRLAECMRRTAPNAGHYVLPSVGRKKLENEQKPSN